MYIKPVRCFGLHKFSIDEHFGGGLKSQDVLFTNHGKNDYGMQGSRITYLMSHGNGYTLLL